jgi:hypothetical protein
MGVQDQCVAVDAGRMGMTTVVGTIGRRTERFVLSRVRTSLDREVWSTRLDFIRLAWKGLFAAAGIVVTTGVGVLVVPIGSATGRHIVAGALFASAFWIVYSVTAIRTYNVTVGSWAEGWTREVLRHRDLDWSVHDDLFLGPGNIDHVAVTQDEVLVVESKYRGHSKRPDRDRHRSDVEQAAKEAWRVKQDLRARGLDVSRVVPVIVVWGPGGAHLPFLDSSSKVEVVSGQEFKDWCRERSNKRLVSLAQRKEIAAALSQRRRQHDDLRSRQPT